MAAFAGFDVSGFPGVATMAKLKANTNLVWCGFYLGPAPSHPDDGWMKHRAEISNQGWGIVPIYVGQQVIGKGSKHPSAEQGTKDALNAVDLLAKAGFAPDTCIYLDLENGKPFLPEQAAYVGTWVDGIAAKGFKPGIYCSHDIAAAVHAVRPAARIWAFKVPTTDPHDAPGPPFHTPAPSSSGFTDAQIIQFDQKCTITVPNVGKFVVDLDSALSANPGT